MVFLCDWEGLAGEDQARARASGHSEWQADLWRPGPGSETKQSDKAGLVGITSSGSQQRAEGQAEAAWRPRRRSVGLGSGAATEARQRAPLPRETLPGLQRPPKSRTPA